MCFLQELVAQLDIPLYVHGNVTRQVTLMLCNNNDNKMLYKAHFLTIAQCALNNHDIQ